MSQLVLEKLQKKFSEAMVETHNFRGDETVILRASYLKPVCYFLRDEPSLSFDMLTDATAVDFLHDPEHPGSRFEVVYHFYSTHWQHRLRIKISLVAKEPLSEQEEEPEVDSLCEIWPIANWLEREIWDMYGIRFRGHPLLNRILLYEEFVGHPLRKDYPKDKRQPLVRRPPEEIVQVLADRGSARVLIKRT